MTQPDPAAPPPGDAAPDRPDFGLADERGNARIAALVAEVTRLVAAGEVNRREALVRVGDGMQAIAADYPDALDETVRTEVVTALDPAMRAAGFTTVAPFEF